MRIAGYGEVAVCEVVQALAEKRAEAAAELTGEGPRRRGVTGAARRILEPPGITDFLSALRINELG